MTRLAIIRFVETFFRRWYLFLLPFALLCALGLATVASQDREFRSTAMLSSSTDTLLSNLAGGDTGSAWESPAQSTSRRINEFLRTDRFVETVVESAAIDATVAGLPTIEDVRGAVYASAEGETLVRVAAVTADGPSSAQLVASTIDVYVQTISEASSAESVAAEEFFTDLAAQYAVDLEAGRRAIDQYLRDNPVNDEEARPLAQQIEIERLRDIAEQAEASYGAALNNIQDARLSVARTIADAEQRLQLIDSPSLPIEPEGSRRGDILMVGMFAAVGLVLALFAAGVTSFNDRTVRHPKEIGAWFGADLLATVPNAAPRLWPTRIEPVSSTPVEEGELVAG